MFGHIVTQKHLIWYSSSQMAYDVNLTVPNNKLQVKSLYDYVWYDVQICRSELMVWFWLWSWSVPVWGRLLRINAQLCGWKCLLRLLSCHVCRGHFSKHSECFGRILGVTTGRLLGLYWGLLVCVIGVCLHPHCIGAGEAQAENSHILFSDDNTHTKKQK